MVLLRVPRWEYWHLDKGSDLFWWLVWFAVAAGPVAAGIGGAFTLAERLNGPIYFSTDVGRWSAVSVSIAGFAGLFVGAGLVATRHGFWARRGLTWILTKIGCPSCHYDLRRLTPEADGCTVCPECGAAWRVPMPE